MWFSYVWFMWVDKPKWLWRDCSFTVNFSRECLRLIPHENFSFEKIWLLTAQFEIRQLNLKGACRILGNAIGKAPKDKVIYMLSFSIYYIINLAKDNIQKDLKQCIQRARSKQFLEKSYCSLFFIYNLIWWLFLNFIINKTSLTLPFCFLWIRGFWESNWLL